MLNAVIKDSPKTYNHNLHLKYVFVKFRQVRYQG